MDVEFYDPILLNDWLKPNFSSPSIVLPLDFREILNIFESKAHFITLLISCCDVIKFLNHKPQKWQTLALYHVADIHIPWFSWKLFYVASNSLEITIVLSFLKFFLELLKKKKNIPTLKVLKISQKSNGRIFAKCPKFL